MNYVSEWFLPKYLIASEKCNQHLGTMTCRLVPFLFQTVLSWKCHDCSLLTCGRIAKICRLLQSLYSEPFSLQKNFKKEAMLISNEKQFQVFSCLYVAFFAKFPWTHAECKEIITRQFFWLFLIRKHQEESNTWDPNNNDYSSKANFLFWLWQYVWL
jgi:hypothetical protein